jgi:gamma-glutamylaminecyclotransferase
MIDLFVYGTLMRGERGHALLRGARLVASARTAPVYELVDMGGYPAMIAGGGRSIAGEIHAVHESAFAALDVYEDVHDSLYRRERIVVAGRAVQAYLLPRAHAEGKRAIASGDWRRR